MTYLAATLAVILLALALYRGVCWLARRWED